MLLTRRTDQHQGKVIKEIFSDGCPGADLNMVEEVKILFTDGTSIILRRDWRGQECYISEYTA